MSWMLNVCVCARVCVCVDLPWFLHGCLSAWEACVKKVRRARRLRFVAVAAVTQGAAASDKIPV